MVIKGRYIVLLILLSAFVVLYPFKVTVVPSWRIQVVDTSGNPVPNMGIRQEWQHYSIEKDGHWEDSITDENGYATFPERTARASLLQRMFIALTNAPWVLHASWGSHSYIIVLAGPDYLNDAASFNGTGSPPSRVVLRHRSEIPPLKDYEPIVK